MSEPSLKDRVLLYNLMQLPGQPQMMHVGSSNLVNDLAAEVTRLTRQVGEATGRIETDGKLIASLEAEVARLTAEQVAVPPDREGLARWLTDDADLIQGNLPGIAHRIRSAAAALRTPTDEWRAGAEAMREACVEFVEAWADQYVTINTLPAAIRTLNIPSPPAKKKSLATFGPPDAGYYREETP